MNWNWIAVASAVALLAPIANGEIVQGEEWHPETLSTSPTRNHTLTFFKVPDSEVAPRKNEDPRPGPGDAISLYLVRKRHRQVITEIDPNFRCYRSQTNRFTAYWSRDGLKVAVVFDYHVNSGLAVFTKSAADWHKLRLPEFDWETKFQRLAKAHQADASPMKGFVDNVCFKKKTILVEFSGVTNGPSNFDLSVVVAYHPSGRHWGMHVASEKAEKIE